MRKSSIFAALLLLTPAVVRAETLEDLLVEKGVITKGEAGNVSSSSGPGKVYWNKGSTLDFADVGFTAKINTLIQTRYTFDDGESKNTSSFQVNRAKLVITGKALNEEFSYMLETNMVGKSGGAVDNEATPHLENAFIAWHPCDIGWVKMGQYKIPFSRQYQNSDTEIQFPDRSVVTDYFTSGRGVDSFGRESGLSGGWSFIDGIVETGAGIFNGTSDQEGINRPGQDTLHTGIVNVRVNPLGRMNSFSEGDIDWTEAPAVSAGAAYAYAEGKNDLGMGQEDVNSNNFDFDANFKWIGWSVHAEYIYESYRPDVESKSQPQGFYLQSGFFVLPKKLEIAARYALIDCDNNAGDVTNTLGVCNGNRRVNEASASINYYIWKHYLKAQLGYTHLNDRVTPDDQSDTNDNRYIFQLSGYF